FLYPAPHRAAANPPGAGRRTDGIQTRTGASCLFDWACCCRSGLMAVAAPPVSHDFNADGSNDYPVSVTGYDAADPVDGAARMWSGASKAIIDTIVGDETNTLFGWSIGSAGDL